MQTYLITGANRGIGLELNAGLMAPRQAVDDMDYEEWMASFAINAIAPWRVSVGFVHQLELSSRPRVVALTSQMGSLERAGSDRVAYRSSKAAANMAMRTLALEWRTRGITVCMLHPGWVRTDMGGDDASLDSTDSASGLLQVVSGLTMQDSGRFLDFEGHDLPW